MSCLRIHDLYDFLEGGLPPEQAARIEEHLRACRRCRQAAEDRQLIAEAASSLPPYEVPADFADRVMARLPEARAGRSVRLIGLAAAASVLALIPAAMIVSGSNALGILTRAGHLLSEYVKSAAIVAARAMTLLTLAGKTIRSLLESASKGLSLANSLLSPGLLVIALGLMTVIFLSLGLAARKKTSPGDQT